MEGRGRSLAFHSASAASRLAALKSRLATAADARERKEIKAEIRGAERSLARLRRAERRARRDPLALIRNTAALR
jgi:hypothetical protein